MLTNIPTPKSHTACLGHYSSLSSATQPLRQRRPLLEAVSVGTCASASTGGDSCGGGGFGGGQQRQQRQSETLSPQQLREWVSQRRVLSGVDATSLGACESASTGAVLAEALLTFTLDSDASRCFFCDCTTVTPLTTPVPVTLADPSCGPVVARGTIVLPYPAVPSGSLTGFHLPSVATNLESNAVLQDHLVTTTTPGGELVAICTDSVTIDHLAMFTRRSGFGLYTLHIESAHFAAFGQVAASCSCRLLTHPTLLWHHRIGHPSLQRLHRMHSRLLVSGLPRSLPRYRHRLHRRLVLIPWIRVVCHQLSPRFCPDLSILRLHSDRGGGFSSGLLEDFCCEDGITLSFTLPASPQQNWIAERRIGFVIEVARTSMIHAASPHFMWSFAVRYTAHRLNLWPHVFEPETSPTLRWTGEVGDASAFWVWGSMALVHDTTTDKLSSRAVRCVFLGFPTDAPGWQFYHLACCVMSSHDVTFDDVSLVTPPPLVEPLEISIGPAKGGNPATDDTATSRCSSRLEIPPAFPPRPSLPPLLPVAVNSSTIGGGGTGGADTEGSDAGGAGSRAAAVVSAGDSLAAAAA
ncbi:unnamed protein product [Closterium sp. NIES-54]